jgi:hypothetical protein
MILTWQFESVSFICPKNSALRETTVQTDARDVKLAEYALEDAGRVPGSRDYP